MSRNRVLRRGNLSWSANPWLEKKFVRAKCLFAKISGQPLMGKVCILPSIGHASFTCSESYLTHVTCMVFSSEYVCDCLLACVCVVCVAVMNI